VKLTCKQMTAMATDRAEGALDVTSRLAFDEHLRTCDGCRAYLRQLDLTRQALRRIPTPEISPALNSALMDGFEKWAAAKGGSAALEGASPRRFSPWALLGVIGTVVLLVAFAHERSQAPQDWMIGGGLALAAVIVSSLAGRFAVGIVLAAVIAAIAAALVGGSAGAIDPGTGAECLMTELFSAAVVAGAAWFGVGRGSRATMWGALAAGGVAGALAADAALQVTCRAHLASFHVLAFHLGGVLLVAAAALTVLMSGRAQARP